MLDSIFHWLSNRFFIIFVSFTREWMLQDNKIDYLIFKSEPVAAPDYVGCRVSGVAAVANG